MAVKSILPRDVYSICMTYKKLTELKTFLMELFSNPKMREAVPGAASVSSDPSVFSIGQHMENNVVNSTVADVGKIRQDMNAMQVRFNKISSADFIGKSSNKPWKPEVTPPRRRGELIEVEEVDSLIISSEMTGLKKVIVMVAKMGIITREMEIVLLEIEDKTEVILEVLCMVKV